MPRRRIGEVDVYLYSFSDLCTRWRWHVSFTPRPLHPQERVPGTYWIGGWMGPTSLIFILILSSHALAIPNELYQEVPFSPSLVTGFRQNSAFIPCLHHTKEHDQPTDPPPPQILQHLYKSRSYSLCNILNYPCTRSALGPSTFLSSATTHLQFMLSLQSKKTEVGNSAWYSRGSRFECLLGHRIFSLRIFLVSLRLYRRNMGH
jgi:hypothetical protein